MKKPFVSAPLLTLITSFLITSSLLAQVPAYVPTDGLVGYWPFNGNANDESGNGNHGTVNGATLTADRNGNANSAYAFNNNSYITINPSPNLVNIQEITFNCFANAISLAGNEDYLISWWESNSNRNFGMRYNKNANPYNCLFVEATTNGIYETCLNGNDGNSALAINSTFMLTTTINQSSIQLYRNGVLIHQCASGGILNFTNSQILIGWDGFGAYFDGIIDDIAIYNRALTPEEITALYNGTTAIPGCTNTTACNYNASATQDDGSCTFPAQTYLNCAGDCLNDANNNDICDEVEANFPSYLPANGLVAWYPFNGNANDESGNGNHGTVNGATLTTDRNGNANSAYSFDGVSNFIQLPLSISNQPISVSCWFKTNTIGFQSIVDNDIAPLYGNDIILSYPYYGLNSHDKICLLYHDSTFKSGFSYSQDINYHVVAIWNNGLCQLFVNGILVGSKSHVQGIVEGGLFRFGVHSSNNGWFNGLIDDIAIYNRALTQEEITALYNGTTNNNSGNNNNTSNTTVPAGISYQAVARNAQGTALANTAVQVKFSLITDSLSGSTEYVETHSLSTNSMGLFATAFGTGTPATGTWAGINWTHSNKYLKVELDAGNGFVDLGTQQLLSSPFAIRAQSAATIENGALPVYSDNAAAIAGGLTVGKLYRTATGELKVVY